MDENPNAKTMPGEVFYEEIFPYINMEDEENEDEYYDFMHELEVKKLLVPVNFNEDGMADEFILPDKNVLARYTDLEASNIEFNNDYSLVLYPLKLVCFQMCPLELKFLHT